VHVQIHFLAGFQQFRRLGVAQGSIAHFAGIEVVLGVDNVKIAVVVRVRTAVEHLGVQLLLHGVDVVVRGDFLAVFPLRSLIERNAPGLVGIALGNAILADIFRCYINGEVRGHFRNDGIAILVRVHYKGIEADGDVVQNDAVVTGLPGMGVPVQAAAHGGHGGVVGVHLFVGVVFAGFARIDIGGHLAAGTAFGLHGGDFTGVECALAGIVRLGRRKRAFRQCGKAREHQQHGCDHRDDSLHLEIFLLLFLPIPLPNERLI